MQGLPKDLKKFSKKANFRDELPETAGVYVFFKAKNPIYVGKAVNLKRRVLSYFDLNLEAKTATMVKESDSISFIKVTSELEALLLEAKLIRFYMPRYNIAAKDDKHPLYIIITNDKYPQVLSCRKLVAKKYKWAYGPFPSASSVRFVLRMIRKIFPYADHKVGKRGCLYSHIGLCDPCPSVIELKAKSKERRAMRKQYLRNVRKIKFILDGKINKVRRGLEKEMGELSQIQEYEAAAKVREQIRRIEYVTQPQTPAEFFLENPNLYSDIRQKELSELGVIIKYSPTRGVGELRRIECFDIAHLAGTKPAASMVTFTDGEPDKKFYRHFRVRQKKGNSDVDSLKEIIKRRIKHLEDWGKPDLMIVDGGKPQVGVFVREIEGFGIPVVGLAKRFETLVVPIKYDGTLGFKEFRLPRGHVLNLVQRVRNEAHRFARSYHHKLISRELTSG